MMASEWDAYAAEWENEPIAVQYAHQAFESLKKIVDVRGKHVLDFGCGTGLLSQILSPLVKDIVALDSSEAMIEQLDLKELSNVEPVVDLLTRGLVAIHPAFRHQFDLVVASSVCSFLPNYSDTADVIYSLLNKGNYFVHWDWLSDNDEPGGMTAAHVLQVLSSVGFEEVEVTTPFHVESPHGKMTVLMAIARK